MKPRMKLLHGTAQLAGDGVHGAIDVIEDMHLAVLGSVAAFVPFTGLLARATASAYARVHDITAISCRATQGALGLLERVAPAARSREPFGASQLAWVSALNGAIGDHLETSGNPLAIGMGLYQRGDPIEPAAAGLGRAIAAARGRLVLFVHGLGMNDLQWRDAGGATFGDRLEAERLGHALHLRYNSGRPVATNGRDLSRLLQALHDAHPAAIERIVLVGHSMGGLVCRSAGAHAEREGSSWGKALESVICLGTPHAGAPLERLGESVGRLLAAVSHTRALSSIAAARSAGIKDLREGWSSGMGGDDGADAERLPFGERVRWSMLAATLSPRADGARARWIGDGLVPVPSALGRQDGVAQAERFAASHRVVLTRCGHMDLLASPRAYAQVREWIVAARAATAG